MIRQFDVFENRDPSSRNAFPFMVVLQSDAVGETRSVIAAPLVARPDWVKSERVQPVFNVSDRKLALILTDMAAVPRSMLKHHVTNVADGHDRIMSALDLIFIGF